MSELKKNIQQVQEKIHYRFYNTDLLYQAFTRSSYSAEFGTENNEVLEFIGDSVLNSYVVKIMTNKFGFMKKNSKYYDKDRDLNEYCIVANINEADFTEIKKYIVSNKYLSNRIDAFGFAKYLFMSDSDRNNEVYKQEKVKADLFEAIIGAIAIDSNWNQNNLQEAIKYMLNIDNVLNKVDTKEKRPEKFQIENAINTLKELAEQGYCSKPEYHINDEQVYKNNRPYWECTCYVSRWGIRKTAYCRSKKEAKRYAAYLVLCEHYNLHNEFED